MGKRIQIQRKGRGGHPARNCYDNHRLAFRPNQFAARATFRNGSLPAEVSA